jgi:endonuclease III
MRRDEKATRIMAILGDLYPEPPIPLDHEDAYTLLVAVLMSAQTTDAQVNRVTPELFALASTPRRMVSLGPRGILSAIKTCGLAPTKAKNIHRLSEMLLEQHGGVVPNDLEALEALPGVGHKTASVVMSQAFGRAAFPVDTHIHRLAARWGLSKGTNVVHTERDLKKVFPESSWSKLHLQIIYFGREYCPALGHDLSTCTICGWAATKKRIAAEAKKSQKSRRRAS